MSVFLKWVSVLLFLSVPSLLISAIWLADWRLLLISGVTGFFSMLAGGFATAAESAGGSEQVDEGNVYTLF